ncbi:hypothetical protein D9615_000260 [Tricholomella constricta]|uniref:Uncharacterized protein n=1 Tax=Tricholomella constricta TaxID=117010 RepID=A0A8H5HRI6_9AGAR|nr:hypothetical protein D9615_000260 [Tricholomella constricta]
MGRIRHRRAYAQRRAIIPDIVTGILDLPTPSLSLPLGENTGSIPVFTTSSSVSESLSDSLPFTSSSIDSSSSASTSASSIQSSSEFTKSPPPPTPTPSPNPAPSVYETTSDGQVHTITTFLNAVPSAPPSAVPPPPKSFLQNKVLSGVVFALVGLVGLVIILAVATFAIRRKRNKELLNEAISFNPSSTMDSTHHYGDEKNRTSMGFSSPRTSDDHNSYSGPGVPGHGFGAGPNHAQGRTERDHSFPKLPARALPPQGYVHGRREKLPAPGQSNGINWGPNLSPFTAPVPANVTASSPVENTVDARAQSQNRILKIANV